MGISETEKQILDDLATSESYPKEKINELSNAIREQIMREGCPLEDLEVISLSDIENYPKLELFIDHLLEKELQAKDLHINALNANIKILKKKNTRLKILMKYFKKKYMKNY